MVNGGTTINNDCWCYSRGCLSGRKSLMVALAVVALAKTFHVINMELYSDFMYLAETRVRGMAY